MSVTVEGGVEEWGTLRFYQEFVYHYDRSDLHSCCLVYIPSTENCVLKGLIHTGVCLCDCRVIMHPRAGNSSCQLEHNGCTVTAAAPIFTSCKLYGCQFDIRLLGAGCTEHLGTPMHANTALAQVLHPCEHCLILTGALQFKGALPLAVRIFAHIPQTGCEFPGSCQDRTFLLSDMDSGNCDSVTAHSCFVMVGKQFITIFFKPHV